MAACAAIFLLFILICDNRENFLVSFCICYDVASLFYVIILAQAVYYAARAPIIPCDNLAFYNLPYVLFKVVERIVEVCLQFLFKRGYFILGDAGVALELQHLFQLFKCFEALNVVVELC